jgi:hypothetical protein
MLSIKKTRKLIWGSSLWGFELSVSQRMESEAIVQSSQDALKSMPSQLLPLGDINLYSLQSNL